MKRLLLAIALAVLALPAAATAAQTWHSQQPAADGGYPLLGEVGDLECWNGQANRCLLITAGNAGVAAGIFAYDGSGWYRYSTVCGGHEGRIAWAGPTEFWTISDQQPAGQIPLPGGTLEPYWNVSLCHFKDGQVVASYGEAVTSATAYRHMLAAACNGPGDCWFGGERLSTTTSVNPGAFHLHWNGSALTAVPSPTEAAELADPGRSVTGIAYHDGSFYEGVDVAEGDVPNAAEELVPQPSFVHRIDPGAPEPFEPLFGEGSFFLGGEATELDGFHLTGADSEDLWAIAGSSGEATPLVLRLTETGLARLALTDPEGLLEAETQVRSAAAEPGENAAWVALKQRGEPLDPLTNPARLARIDGDGVVGPQVSLPLAGEQFGGEAVGRKGLAGPISCPGPEQCWMATRRGWLFHLGADPAPQADPALHVLISSRPPDNSLPSIPPLELPEDDSGSELEPSEQEELPPEFEPAPKRKPALVSRIKQKMVGETVLELSFTLSAKAQVWLVGRRAGSVVAKTPRRTLAKGRRSVRVRLNPDRWPTKLDLKAKKLKKAKGSK